jgi:uncharacterized protein
MTMYTPLLFLFGLAAGTMGTMMGVGMGFVHVPFLILLFNFSPQAAIGTSIAIIFINTLGGSIVYYHQGRMDFDLAAKLSLAVLPGAIIGPFIVEQYSSSMFSTLFAGALLLSAMNLMFGRRPLTVLPKREYSRHKTVKDVFGNTVSYSTNMELGVFGTVLIGFLSNLLGVGGGIVHVPFLILLLKIPTHIAIGTSHLILCVSSLVGTIVFASLGHVDINFAIPIGVGAILGASLGADLARKTQAQVLRRMLAVLLIFVGVKMALGSS